MISNLIEKFMMNLSIMIEIQKVSAHTKAYLREMQTVSRKHLFES